MSILSLPQLHSRHFNRKNIYHTTNKIMLGTILSRHWRDKLLTKKEGVIRKLSMCFNYLCFTIQPECFRLNLVSLGITSSDI